ncbi:uncharacterized protein [Montipora capricornis]|uniref:uncharacterized protein n=1 Tax=Montipora capricornis TaxID=246305 RepID=UPI0035F11070
MALFFGNLLLFVTIYRVQNAQAKDKFGIVPPWPDNIYPIEFTSAKVTCVAFDSAGIKTPKRIDFVRKNQYAEYTTLKQSDNLNFTSQIEMTEQGGKQLKKLFVTMLIKNVTEEDDSQFGSLGRYECHAFAGGDHSPKKHGFSINVIRYEEIPRVHVTKPGVLQHEQNFTMTCNLTNTGRADLKRISWFKNGMLLQGIRCPDPSSPEDFLPPLVIKDAGTKDGGIYTCVVEVFLRNVLKYNVTDIAMVTVAPWIDKPIDELKVHKKKGQQVSFECRAGGFPLEVQWQAEAFKKDSVEPSKCINESDKKYGIAQSGIDEPYILTLSDLQYSDAGYYYCCLSSNCSSSHPNRDNCQRFTLVVSGQSSTRQICETYMLVMLFLSTTLVSARNML